MSRLGTAIFDVVLAWWLIEQTGSAAPVGYVLAASVLPIAVLGPFGGVLVDRWNKKHILIVADLVSGAAALGVAVMAYRGEVNLPLVVACCFVLGAASSMFKPAVRAIVPLLVGRSELVRANSVTTNVAETTKLAGPLVGAWLIALPLVGVPGAFLVNALSYWVSAAVTAFVSYRHDTATRPVWLVFGDLRQGLRYIAGDVLLSRLVILCGLVNFFLVSFNVLLPLYVQRVLHRGEAFYSYLLAAEAAGGIAATVVLLVGPAIRPRPRLFAAFLALGGASLGLMSVLTSSPAVLGMAFAQGFFIGGFNAMFFACLQETVAAELTGRVFAVVYLAAFLAMPLSYLTFGYLGDSIVGQAFLYAGIGTVLCCVPFLRPRVRVPRRTAVGT